MGVMSVQQNEFDQNYIEALEYLESLQFHKIKLGLAPMRDFLALLGNPEQQLKIIHVAGTNGKGSVCSGLASVCQQSGYSVGMYTSPHLSSPRERFKCNDSFISKTDFSRLTQAIRAVLAGRSITYFEFTTTLAFLWFYEKKVDLVLLETGLGGRLDATNVIEKPLLTIITSVSMDHQAYLGNTLAAVVSEKAGIIKRAVPVVCGNRDPEVISVVQNICETLAAPLFCLGQDFDFLWHGQKIMDYSVTKALEGHCFQSIESPRVGRYQAENTSLIISASILLREDGFTISEDDIRRGLRVAQWPGRLEYFELKGCGDAKFCRYLLDGAHNPAGVMSLIDALSQYSYDKLICIWGAMVDKDVAGGLAALVPHLDILILTGIENERAATPSSMESFLAVEARSKTLCCETVDEALVCAQQVYSENDLILVAGSLYLIGALRPLLLGELA